MEAGEAEPTDEDLQKEWPYLTRQQVVSAPYMLTLMADFFSVCILLLHPLDCGNFSICE